MKREEGLSSNKAHENGRNVPSKSGLGGLFVGKSATTGRVTNHQPYQKMMKEERKKKQAKTWGRSLSREKKTVK